MGENGSLCFTIRLFCREKRGRYFSSMCFARKIRSRSVFFSRKDGPTGVGFLIASGVPLWERRLPFSLQVLPRLMRGSVIFQSHAAAATAEAYS